MRWKYFAEIVAGDLFAAVSHINKTHPEWDVVTMTYYVGVNSTIVIRREPL